jgi:hypothetical protein
MRPRDQGFIEINNYPDDSDEDKQVKQSRRG